MTHRILYFGFFLIATQHVWATHYVAEEYKPIFQFSDSADTHTKLSEAAVSLSHQQLETICSHASNLFTDDMKAKNVYFILRALQPLSVQMIEDFALNMPHFYTANMIGEGYTRIAQAIKKIPKDDRVDVLVMVNEFPDVYERESQSLPLDDFDQAKVIEQLSPRDSSKE